MGRLGLSLGNLRAPFGRPPGPQRHPKVGPGTGPRRPDYLKIGFLLRRRAPFQKRVFLMVFVKNQFCGVERHKLDETYAFVSGFLRITAVKTSNNLDCILENILYINMVTNTTIYITSKINTNEDLRTEIAQLFPTRPLVLESRGGTREAKTINDVGRPDTGHE